MRTDLPIYNESVALLDNPTHTLSGGEKAALGLVGIGAVAFVVALASDLAVRWPLVLFAIAAAGFVGGGLTFAVLSRGAHRRDDNHGVMFSQNTARGAFAWVFAVVLTLLYVLLYWYPETLTGVIALVDPLSQWMRGQPATLDNGGQWFLYGTFYTGAILVMGVRALRRYWKSRYHTAKTISVMFFQFGFAWMLPYLLVRFNQPELYLHYFWPLDYYLLFPSSVEALWESGALGAFMVFWSIALLLIATPILTYFFGKRWYCSWVCGCGGLAETAGDSYRHLSSKSLTSWKVERWMIHSVLVIIVAATALLWYSASTGSLAWIAYPVSQWYGFVIGAAFAGVVGVGFYPLMGPRVWCRFGCPMAAILGLQQRFFSRFRITTNHGQCISCGNCSAYCHMGIDVRWYAQRGQNVVRASCVGCGICASVCPRGVLRLENGPVSDNRPGTAHLNLIGDLDILIDD